MAVLQIIVMTLLLPKAITSQSKSTFTIHTDINGPTLIDEFLGFTIDAYFTTTWKSLEPMFSSTSAITLATGLSPAYFRFGGTNEDSVIYISTTTKQQEPGDLLPTNLAYLNVTQFQQLTNFAKLTGNKFIFGHMLQYRFNNNTFDPSNSINLFNNIKSNGLSSDIFAFELGNEPNVYSDSYGQENKYQLITPQQNAMDMITFKTSFDLFGFNNIQIWGCDATHGGLDNYLSPYIQTLNQSSTKSVINKITWHHYYGDGNDWKVNDFINIDTLDSFIISLNDSLAARNKYLPSTPILLGETGGGYGSFSNPLAAAFVAGFMWLDKLGLSAIGGLEALARQKFWSGDDALLNAQFQPNPDYWSSYLFKGLVGNKALYVDDEFMTGRVVRTYAFCARVGVNRINKDISYKAGDITVMILNVGNVSVTIDLMMDPVDGNGSYDLYLLTGDPSSSEIALNGKMIEMGNGGSLPVLEPKSGDEINMDGLSYGFVVIKNANATACL